LLLPIFNASGAEIGRKKIKHNAPEKTHTPKQKHTHIYVKNASGVNTCKKIKFDFSS